MANNLVRSFRKIIASANKKPTSYTTTATVVRVDEGVAWVHIDGGAEETPAKMGINCDVGDTVTVRIANKAATVSGNVTAPPTDDTEANAVREVTRDSVTYIKELQDKDVTVRKITATTGYIGDLTAYNITTENIKATTGYIGDLTADDITTETIKATTGYIGDLTADNITTDDIKAATGYIGDLEADNIQASDIIADHATVGSLDTYYAHITDGVIDNAKIGYADVKDLNANYAHITDGAIDNATIGYGRVTGLDANFAHIQNGVIDNAKIGYADVNGLDANFAHVDMSNVTNSWIENGVIRDAAIGDAQIIGVSANKLTAGTIDAGKINVANLRAKNLIVDRINGQPVIGGMEIVTPRLAGIFRLPELKALRFPDETILTIITYYDQNPHANGWYEYINGVFVVTTDTSVVDGKTYYRESAPVEFYDQAYIDAMEEDINQRIAGAMQTYTGTDVPTLLNYPAVDWTTADQKASHVGNIYYLINEDSQYNGYCYRFAYDNTTQTYDWILIKDSDITAILQDIDELQQFQSDTVSWINETDQGLVTIRQNHTQLAGLVNTVKNTADNALPASTFTTFESTTFKTLTDTVDEQTSDITTLSERVDTKADSSTVTTLSNTVSTVSQTATSNSSHISNLTTVLGVNADGTTAENDIMHRMSDTEQDLDGFKTTVSSTYQTKSDMANYSTTTQMQTAINQSASSIQQSVAETYHTISDFNTFKTSNTAAIAAAKKAGDDAQTDLNGYKSTVENIYASKALVTQTAQGIRTDIAATYLSLADFSDYQDAVASEFDTIEETYVTNTTFETSTEQIYGAIETTETTTKSYTDGKISQEVTDRNAAIVAKAGEITSQVSSTYATKTALADTTAIANSKRRIFKDQPTPPYEVGDLWVQGANGDILRCDTARATGSYIASDWVVASKYTDDSSLNSFVSTTYTSTINQLEGEIDLRATKSEVATSISNAKAEIKITTDSISSEVSKKVNGTEVISKINQSPEEITINANRVNIAGATVFQELVSNVETLEESVDGIKSIIELDILYTWGASSVTANVVLMKDGQDIHTEYPTSYFVWELESENEITKLGNGYQMVIPRSQLNYVNAITVLFALGTSMEFRFPDNKALRFPDGTLLAITM